MHSHESQTLPSAEATRRRFAPRPCRRRSPTTTARRRWSRLGFRVYSLGSEVSGSEVRVAGCCGFWWRIKGLGVASFPAGCWRALACLFKAGPVHVHARACVCAHIYVHTHTFASRCVCLRVCVYAFICAHYSSGVAVVRSVPLYLYTLPVCMSVFCMYG